MNISHNRSELVVPNNSALHIYCYMVLNEALVMDLTGFDEHQLKAINPICHHEHVLKYLYSSIRLPLHEVRRGSYFDNQSKPNQQAENKYTSINLKISDGKYLNCQPGKQI